MFSDFSKFFIFFGAHPKVVQSGVECSGIPVKEIWSGLRHYN